ncbi:MAG: hypothetical protein RLZZ350_843 [Verrucomicrobiota bacterium]|jgi:hypothetical protein
MQVADKTMKSQPESFSLKYLLPAALVIITSILTSYFTAKIALGNERNQKRWEIKRQAGLRALSVVDQYNANCAALGQFSGMGSRTVSYDFKPMNLEELRSVYNELAVACESAEAPKIYMEILSSGRSEGRQSVAADRILDLQNAIRIELGFGQPLQLNRHRAWVADMFPGIATNSPPHVPNLR